jgi:hypothetical protein
MFTVVFLLAAGLGFLQVWIGAVCSVPARPSVYLADFIPAAKWALPFTLYATILMSMSYASRRRVPMPLAFVLLFVLAFVFAYSISLGISNAAMMDAPPLDTGHGTLGKPGLVLSGHGTTVVLLDDPAEALGERVVSINGNGNDNDRPLFFQPEPVEPGGDTPIPLPSIPFSLKNIALFDSLLVDFSLSAEELSARFAEGPVSFAAYTGAIIFILLSLAAVLEIGAWPLANIFIGAVLFRLILSFEVFICDRDTFEYLADFFGRWMPRYLTIPAILGAIGVLLTLYSVLVFAARGGGRRHG